VWGHFLDFNKIPSSQERMGFSFLPRCPTVHIVSVRNQDVWRVVFTRLNQNTERENNLQKSHLMDDVVCRWSGYSCPLQLEKPTTAYCFFLPSISSSPFHILGTKAVKICKGAFCYSEPLDPEGFFLFRFSQDEHEGELFILTAALLCCQSDSYGAQD